MIASLFWEVEDVLVRTGPLRRAALLRVLAEDELVPPGTTPLLDEAHLADAGGDTRSLVRDVLRVHAVALDEAAVTLLAMRIDREFASRLQAGVSLAPGARELVALASGSCRLAIVTGLARATVDSLLALAELDGAFEVIIAAEDVAAAKPSPDGYRRALERLTRRRPLDSHSGLALEPGPAGARAARAAGLRCVVVAPFRVESIVDASAMLASLVGETPASLDAMLAVRAAG
jgi:beta-phosphoglucomutase-like phosphatase (HAD superfamily)